MTEHDRDPRIHPYIFKGTELPFHTPDKPFGMTQAEWEEQKEEYFSEVYKGKNDSPELGVIPPPIRLGTISLYPKDTPVLCSCGIQATYYMSGKAYCIGCWAQGDDEDV